MVTLTEVSTISTRGGNVRYTVRDADGNEYTTFREQIGERAKKLQNTRVRIEYHEERRGPYKNVYIDKVEPAGPAGLERRAGAGGDTDPQEAAWRTAVEAAPWLAGEPGETVPPEELYGKLKPFEERVAADIEEGNQDKPG